MRGAGLTVQDERSAHEASTATSARAEELASPPTTAVATTARAEDADCHVIESRRASRPTAEDSGVGVDGDTAASDPEHGADMRNAVALAVSGLFLTLYVELGDDLFLIAASTALGLIAYRIADQRLRRRR
jgi:hypothetical protein